MLRRRDRASVMPLVGERAGAEALPGLVRFDGPSGPYVELTSGVLWGSHEVVWTGDRWALTLLHVVRSDPGLDVLEERLRTLRASCPFGRASQLDGWPLLDLSPASAVGCGTARLGVPSLTAGGYALALEQLRTVLDLSDRRALVARCGTVYLALPRR